MCCCLRFWLGTLLWSMFFVFVNFGGNPLLAVFVLLLLFLFGGNHVLAIYLLLFAFLVGGTLFLLEPSFC